MHIFRADCDHVPPKTVRTWALIDSSVSYTLALPLLSPRFIDFLYFLNGKLGGDPTVPVFSAMQMFFVCLSGSLVAIWCVARYLRPLGVFALVDGWGRVWVSLLIVWFVAAEGAPRVLLLFVITEMLGAVMQLYAVYRRPAAA